MMMQGLWCINIKCYFVHKHDVRRCVHIRNKHLMALCIIRMHIECLVPRLISQFFVLLHSHVLNEAIVVHSSYENITWTSTLKAITISLSQTSQVQEQRDFLLLFTSSILEHIAQQTNQYTQECLGEWFSAWQLVTVEELCAYIGFMILMGLVPLPSTRDYCRKDPTFHYSPVADRILCDWFLDIHWYLHFIDNSTISSPSSVEY